MINILVCDDDKNITCKISSLIVDIKNKYNIDFNVDIKHNGEFIENSEIIYDIAIIDIEMPGTNGLDLSKTLKKFNPDIIIIILTSYPNYLDNAMEIQVFRYLSKPIDINRFNKNFSDALTNYKKISKTIIIEKADEVHTLKTKDILYIENQKRGSVIVTKKRKFITNKKPLEWHNTINQPDCFVFSHKSYIVNLQNVINFNRNTITFETGNDDLVVSCISQRKYSEFKKSFFNFAGGII